MSELEHSYQVLPDKAVTQDEGSKDLNPFVQLHDDDKREWNTLYWYDYKQFTSDAKLGSHNKSGVAINKRYGVHHRRRSKTLNI